MRSPCSNLSEGASPDVSAARRASGDEGFGGAEPTPGTGAAVGACTCVCVCVGCVSVLSEGGITWSEPARSTPDSSGRPNACCASAIGDREADRRRPIGLESSASARESVGVDCIGGQYKRQRRPGLWLVPYHASQSRHPTKSRRRTTAVTATTRYYYTQSLVSQGSVFGQLPVWRPVRKGSEVVRPLGRSRPWGRTNASTTRVLF